jgi:uncharacterized membrane protein YjgN (DUF898 family)
MRALSTGERLKFLGQGGTLLGIALINGLLSILTLGFYSFWAKTKIRQFFYSETELAGDRFAYHGTGKELLIGSLKATGVLFVLYGVFLGVFMLMGTPEPNAPPTITQSILTLLFPLAFFVLLTIAITGARRYRLSRSSWRGIRFRFVGRWQDYLWLMVRGVLLSIVTLGFYAPHFQNLRRAFLVNNTRFGSLAFSYDGDGWKLFRAFLKALLLTLPTLGLCWVWYAATRNRYFWKHTRAGPARFQSTVTGGALLGLFVTNLLLVICTFGVGTPWAMVRAAAFSADNLYLQGAIDWDTVEQQAQGVSATGEGMAAAFDVDVDVGLGL